MPYFISTETIVESINNLKNTRNSEQNNMLFHFLLLKACKINSLDSQPISNINTYAKPITFNLTSLFNPFENIPRELNFLNPFEFNNWNQKPSEDWNKWIGSRFKNNIIGGGVQWRKILIYDSNEEKLKFTYNYLDVFKEKCNISKQKVDLISLSIWNSRFLEFDKPFTVNQLINKFILDYNITPEERAVFFTTSSNIKLNFSNKIHNSKEIRNLLLNKPKSLNWLNPNMVQIVDSKLINNFKGVIMKRDHELITTEELEQILDLYGQVILSGPPGTSKSFLSEKLKQNGNFGITEKIQFHPQYSYQQFIGGYIVKGNDVKYEPGILQNIITKIKKYHSENPTNQDAKHLLLIDEINRANLSQVFGETIQCLDRGNSVEILIDNKLESFSLPENLYIIGTMNSSDRTIGSIDHALRRRFINIYCPPTPDVLIEVCKTECGISIADLLEKLNSKLVESHNNKELVIGHAIFFNDKLIDSNGAYYWNNKNLEILFNYKILPMIEEYCFGDQEQINFLLGDNLPKRIIGEEFIREIQNFTLGQTNE